MMGEHEAVAATMPAKLPVEERVANWEARHGFQGIMSPSGRTIHRRCACGKATASLANPACVHCEKAAGKWRGGKRTRSYEQCGDEAREEPRALQASYQAPPRRPPPADPSRYLQCRTKGCSNVAKRRGTLCQKCYVAADPETRACPVCKKMSRCTTHQWGICNSCVRNIDRAAVRLWNVSGGHMALACSALVRHGVTANSTHDAKQLLEALEMGALASDGNVIDAIVFGECL